MKKSTGIMGVLIIALLFTGCAEKGNDKNPASSEQQEGTENTSEAASSGRQEGTEDNSAEASSEQQGTAESKEAEAVVLSEEDLARMRSMAEEYYISINRKMLSFTQADPASPFHRQEYEGYEPDEVVMFEVMVENGAAKRYITIGSKDGWINCSVLNEGY